MKTLAIMTILTIVGVDSYKLVHQSVQKSHANVFTRSKPTLVDQPYEKHNDDSLICFYWHGDKECKCSTYSEYVAMTKSTQNIEECDLADISQMLQTQEK